MHPPSLKIEPSQLAEWHSLIADATSIAHRKVNESLEYYLIITLDAFTRENIFVTQAVALDFLNALDLKNVQNNKMMRNIGDQCLLISGLFPEQANRRNVSLDYYIGIGQHAYNTIAISVLDTKIDHHLFLQLSSQFRDLIQILRAIRVMPFQQLLLHLH